MSPAVTTATADLARETTRTVSLTVLRRVVWMVVCSYALFDAWARRFDMFSDGISYLEIARAYVRHDWANAINSYWSPAMSWVAALLFALLKPSPEWELQTYHLVDLLAILISLPCYEFLLARMESRLQIRQLFTFRLVAYAIFIWTTEFLLYAGEIRPDPLLLPPVFLVFASTLIPRDLFSFGHAAAVGALLAFSYFVKTAMFPIAVLSIIAIAVLYGVRRATTAGACFFLIASPLIAALSIHCHHFTLGESGKINYAWEVNGVRRSTNWQGGPHSPRLISKTPPIYAFDAPVPGSFPPWRDPAYFYEGVPMKFDPVQQLKAIGSNGAFALLLLLICPGLVVAMWPGKGVKGRIAWTAVWPMILISACAICLYSAVFVDKRYVAPFIVGLALPAIAAASFGDEPARKNLCLAAIGLCLFFAVPRLFIDANLSVSPTYLKGNPHNHVAQQLSSFGLKAGDRIGYVGHSIDVYWASLLGLRIVAEAPIRYVDHNWINKMPVDDYSEIIPFWRSQTSGLAAMKRAGAKIVIANETPRWADLSGWQKITSNDEHELWIRWLN